jgi:subtilase family serine protease
LIKRPIRLAAAAASVLALVGVGSAGGVSANSGNTSNIVYTANPPRHLAFSSTSAKVTQSTCIKTYGLNCYGPSDIRTAYNVPSSNTGAGQTIVIVDAFGSPTIQNDLHVFDQNYGLPDPTLNIYYPGGKPAFNVNDGNQVGWASETSLDVEWSHAIAPAATIDLVVANTNYGNSLNNAEQFAINNHLGNVMSMSFGSDEAAIAGGGNNLQLQQAEAIYQQAKDAGITVLASAGDGGASDGYPAANALFPASDPYVTAVGGTDLFTSNNGNYKSETTWNDSVPSLCPYGCAYGAFGATGGAPSTLFQAPSYQQALSGNSMRTTADVGYNASVYTAVMTYLGFYGANSPNNGFYFFGGTSEGAPQWAGIIALSDAAAGKSLGFVNPALYAIGANPTEYSADFHDVTVGSNGFNGPGFNAGTGYDLPTGLGTPNVANLISTLSK